MHWIRINASPNTRILHGEYKTDSFPTLRLGFHKQKTGISGCAAAVACCVLTAFVLLPGRLRSLLHRTTSSVCGRENFGLPLEASSPTLKTMSLFPVTIFWELTPSTKILTDLCGL